MSKPVTYSVLIRDGQRQCFEDLWVPLYRELLWGPEAFEAWLTQGSETDDEPEELSGVAIVDFDSKQLRWGEPGVFDLPRAQALHHRMLEQAWPDFSITFLSEKSMYAEIHGDSDHEEEESEFDGRPQNVSDASGESAQDDDEDEGDDEDSVDNEDSLKAWVTIIDQNGKARQRVLKALSADLFAGVKTAVQDLATLTASVVPPEKCVTEGLLINLRDKEIRLWGGVEARRDFSRMQRSWPKWTVSWAANGYADQCAASDLPGIPVTDADALVTFLPQVLSSTRIDLANVFGAMGGQLRKTAIKATGCLVLVLAVPILLTGFFMSKLKEAGYAVAALVVVVAIVFKVIESKFKAKFRKGPLGSSAEPPDTKPPVAGPLDESERREGLDRILRACRFPPLAELEPRFPAAPSLDDLM